MRDRPCCPPTGRTALYRLHGEEAEDEGLGPGRSERTLVAACGAVPVGCRWPLACSRRRKPWFLLFRFPRALCGGRAGATALFGETDGDRDNARGLSAEGQGPRLHRDPSDGPPRGPAPGERGGCAGAAPAARGAFVGGSVTRLPAGATGVTAAAGAVCMGARGPLGRRVPAGSRLGGRRWGGARVHGRPRPGSAPDGCGAGSRVRGAALLGAG